MGTALGRRFSRVGVDVSGFVGRDPERVRAALQLVGAGRELGLGELASAHVVVFAVGDPQLREAVVAAAAAAPPRRCSLWLHTSGRFGLEVFDGLPPGFRRGALHPVAPFADAVSGERAMVGAPAVIEGDARSERLLRRLAALAGMVPMVWRGGDRALYHAGCALAANGATALWGLVERVFAAVGMPATEQWALVGALVGAAVRSCGERGSAAALSGPVRRGDAATVALHVQRLGVTSPDALAAYMALMRAAVPLATEAGLDAAAARAVLDVLAQAAAASPNEARRGS